MSDLPDFWANRYINIVAQDLGELINRPKYGAATPTVFSAVATANNQKQLVTVSGKGMVYGLVVYIQGTDIQHDDYLSYDIDGATYDDVSMEYFMLWNDVLHPGALGWLGCYDEVNYRYAIHIGTGTTFETSVTVYYNEEHGRTPAVFGVGYYALI